MDKLKIINELRATLNDLRLAGTTLKATFTELEAFIDGEKFPEPDLVDGSNKNFNDWINGANKCTMLYYELFGTDKPPTFSELEIILDVAETRIREESIFGQAEKFLLFVAKAPDLRKILHEHQAKLKKLLARKRQNEKLRAALEPYAKFINATAEKDFAKKFSVGKELSELFGDDFIGRGLFGGELNLLTPEEFAAQKPARTWSRKKKIVEPPPPEQRDFAKILTDKGALLTQEDFVPWEKIFSVEKNERNKEFSASRFKRDFKNPEMFKPILSYIAANSMLSWPAFCPKKMSKEMMESIAQPLFNRGYIQKYSFQGYGYFYGLTKNFVDFARTDGGRKFINAKHGAKSEMENVAFLAENAKYILARAAYFFLYNIEMEQKNHFYDLDFSRQAFRATFGNNDERDLWLGCFWETTDNCEKFLKRLRNCLKREKKIDRIFVVGINVQHAKKVFDALKEILADEFPKDAACYLYDFDEVDFYRSDTMEVVITYDIWGTPTPPDDEPEPDKTPDDKPEEFEEVPTVQKSEAPPIDATVKEKILGDVKDMLLDKKFYCAAAYLKARSLELKEAEPLYRQLAFALDDPLLNEGYSADAVSILALQDDDAFNEALLTAAAVRTLFYNDFGVDYGVPALNALTKSFGLVKSNAALSQLIDELKTFKTEQKKGVDLFADYRTKDRLAAEENLAKVIRDAEDYYTRYFEGKLTDRADNETFIRMERDIFSRNGDLAQIFSAIKDKTEARSTDTLNFVKDFLAETFIKENATFERFNIDDEKLNQFIDDKWEKACNKKNPGKLISRLRNNITKNMERAVEIMCAWVNCAEILCAGGDDSGTLEYKKIRARLLDNVQQAQKNLAADAGAVVVAKTLEELSARLDGSYNRIEHKYFYAEFLCGDKVVLDENYLPNFELNISDGKPDGIAEQIKKHAAQELPSFEARIEQIFEAGGDDFGSAQLIDDYLKDINGASFIEQKEYDVAKCVNSAAKDAPRSLENFIGGLELAQSYGQFDTLPEGEKEKILQLVENCYKYAEASKNFGVFFRVKKYWEDVIEDNTAQRAEALKADLSAAAENYKKVADNFNAAELADSVTEIEKIIAARNFTAAQGLIFKLNRGELYKKFDDAEETPLARFIDAEEYSDCYNKVKDSGDSLENLIGKKIFVRDKISNAKSKLVKNWITNPVGEEKIKTLLELLGFSVESVQKLFLLSANTVNFHVKIFGTGQKYSHPIAAFGSDAEIGGFNVSCLFGKFDEKNLVEKFKELGNSNHTLVFLDYALDLPTRRRLAKEIKLEKSLTKVFAVVDRVAIMYLLKNCAAQLGTKRITDTLMSLIMPFARCQPYIWSPRIPLPPEMFIGRENEINEVTNHGGVNIVCGGRQLGKSALLKMACRKIDGNNNERAIFIDIDDKNYREAALLTSRELSDKNFFAEAFETDDWEELTRAIRNRLASDAPTKIPYFLLMLDEADKFIESCAENNYAPIVALAKIQQEDYDGSRFKFVIAGLRNIIRFEREKTFSNNSILPTLKSLTIKPFNVEDARKLLEVPLRYLGLYFPDTQKDSLILTILETANYFPSLIQLYCEKLVRALFEPSYAGYDADTPIYRISEEHIKKILADKEFTKDIKTKIEITLRLGEDKYYYVIANLLAHLYYNQNNVEGYSPKEILTAAESFGLIKEPFLPNSPEKVGALMEELCELNILRKTDETKYLFSRHRILRIVGTLNEVEDALLKLMEAAHE
ncbi:MAG: hypothetical protein II857_07790 [Selenomonadaceae bacterium]|nr:hypothetical protein [Selenomonadaceae bacterium]